MDKYQCKDISFIIFVRGAPAGVSKASANYDTKQTALNYKN